MPYSPPTQTKLANIALDLIGVSSITDYAERSVNAEKIRLHWDITRDELLRAKDWNFATARATLSASATAPAFDWDYAYALPSDYLKALEFNGALAGTGEADYEIAGAYLLSDDDTAELKYSARVENVALWDASFSQAFAHALAAAIAPGLSTSAGMGERMRARAEEIALQAAGPNNRETRPRAVLAQTGSGWQAARYGGTL
jgi:hypothetical protein